MYELCGGATSEAKKDYSHGESVAACFIHCDKLENKYAQKKNQIANDSLLG